MAKKSSRYLQILSYIMILAIFIFFMGINHNCSRLHITEKEGFSGGDTLDIAILYGPGSYYLYDDSLSGINHKIAQEFSIQTNTPVKIWAITDPGNGMAKLNSGAFDILASLPLDNQIKKRFPVSESVFLDKLVLVQICDSITGEKSVNSSLDLNGKTVRVTSGSSALQRIKNLSDEIGGKIEIIEEPDFSDELLALKVANGSFPFAVVNEKVAQKIAESYPLINYESTVSFTQFQVWLFNPKDSLITDKFNIWLDGFRTTDLYRSIISDY